MTKPMTYAGVGVDYDAMDPFKRMAQKAGRATAHALGRHGYMEVEESRGESAYLIETPQGYLAHVEEGLGTKNLVADEMYRLTGKSYYGHIGQDAVAMIVNDMITLGALPLSVAMHLAVGSSDWFSDEKRSRDLVDGWKDACTQALCVWGGGETPTLRDIVLPGTFVLSGSALGLIQPKERRIRANVQHGDAIVLLESSGIHANGLTLARKIAERLPEGYLTRLDTGATYGETLLAPTPLYVSVIDLCLREGVEIHYAVNITGHGWRKLMRAPEPFAYVIETLPSSLPIFDFIQKQGPVSDEEAYENLNMGAGFALYVPETHVERLWKILLGLFNGKASLGFAGAVRAGHVESSRERKVTIKPKNLEYGASRLGVR